MDIPDALNNLLSALARLKRKPEAEVVVYDPAADGPHDMDDPFFDQKVKDRIGAAISKSATKKPDPK